MKKVLSVIIALPAVMFIMTGLRWLVDPATAAAQFGMPLLDGIGLSTQIGDLAAFFIAGGMFVFIALITSKRSWYYPPIMLVGFTALFRVLAWLLHDATLAVQMIVSEIVIAVLLLAASRIIPEHEYLTLATIQGSSWPRLLLLAIVIPLLASSLPAQAASMSTSLFTESSERPNIVLILADDLGFTDLASYGSEISTPNLSTLAKNGLSFTNYHTAASCAPTRAMLLTGVNNHRAGVPNIPEMIPPQQRRHAHYQGTLGRNVVTVATLLQDNGYHTYMAGKWHLGMTPDLLPSRRGFEQTIALADSGADNWEQKPYLPIYEKANWFADGEETTLPEDFYSSRFLVDKAIEFIDSNHADDKPFFTYLPFQAVHMPVQAPQAFIDHYIRRKHLVKFVFPFNSSIFLFSVIFIYNDVQ